MTTNIIDELLYADRIVIINNNHEIKGIYKIKPGLYALENHRNQLENDGILVQNEKK